MIFVTKHYSNQSHPYNFFHKKIIDIFNVNKTSKRILRFDESCIYQFSFYCGEIITTDISFKIFSKRWQL